MHDPNAYHLYGMWILMKESETFLGWNFSLSPKEKDLIWCHFWPKKLLWYCCSRPNISQYHGLESSGGWGQRLQIYSQTPPQFFCTIFYKNLWNFLFTSRKFTKAVSQGADGWLAGCWLKFSSFTSTDYIFIYFLSQKSMNLFSIY